MALLHRLRTHRARRQPGTTEIDPAGGHALPDLWPTSPSASDTVIEHRPRTSDPAARRLLAPYLGAEGTRRAVALQQTLEGALTLWQAEGLLPPEELLREGLLTLEAGHPLPGPQKVLLLRSAIRHQRGLVTALRHQDEASTTAAILAEGLLSPLEGFNPASVQRLRQVDATASGWYPQLLHRLTLETRTPEERRRAQAAAALWELRTGSPLTVTGPGPVRLPNRIALLLLAACLMLVASGLLFWDQQDRRRLPDNLVYVPAGVYLISRPVTAPGEAAGMHRVQLQDFGIQPTEVTVQAYTGCIEKGICSPPAAVPAAWDAPDRQNFPVSGVTWYQADRYCRSLQMRLPLEEEWEVAASVAPASGVTYVYPWGDRYEPTLAKGSGRMDAVGSVGPAGSSPLGLADMAGNVAEWTATYNPERDLFVVKGGSYRDGAADLRAAAWQLVAGRDAQPWLGFRCAVTVD